MECKMSRGRGGGWRRGGRGGQDGVQGDHRGLGRGRGRGGGGSHRGRETRDHHRGRGRAGSSSVEDFPPVDHNDGFDPKEEQQEVFSRRKLESNWDRYEESERAEQAEDTPTRRGEDFHVLLESAGDSFTHFRFSEERDWEMDAITAAQMLVVSVDLSALAQTLQEVPLNQRLNLEAELLEISTPAELPAAVTQKQEVPKPSKFPPPSTSVNSPAPSATPVVPAVKASSLRPAASEPAMDDGDEELDQLLSLQKPHSQSVGGDEKEQIPVAVMEAEVGEQRGDGSPVKSAPVRQEMSEEDLEDWLDSMIS